MSAADGAYELWGRVLDREAVPFLTFAAVAATAWWFAVLAVLATLTRIRDVDPVSAGLELPADHSPALAAMLTNRWRVPRAAAAATVVDLAARGHLTFDRTDVDEYTIAVSATPPAGLRSYEQQVYDLVQRRCDGTAIPLPALTVDGDDGADGASGLDLVELTALQGLLGGSMRSVLRRAQPGDFFSSFAAAVVDEARQHGFSKPRWSVGAIALMTVLAGLPGFFVGALFLSLPEGGEAAGSIVVWTTLGSVTALMAVFFRQRAERQTTEGLAAAARWVGLRENLRSAGSFAELPPTAIVVWDRLLAYAVGLGVAANVAHLLPLEPESPTEAWSRETGAWRLVRIRYHARGRPGWGEAPWKLAVNGLLGLVLAAAGLVVVPPFLTDVSGRLDDSAATTDRLQDALAIGFFVAVACFGAAVVLSARRAAAGLVDVRRSRTIDGTLLRDRPPWLAVDDGSDDDLRAYRAPLLVTSPAYHLLEPGARVRVVASPAVGYVRSIQRLGDPVVTPGPIPPPPGAIPPPPP